MAFDRCGLQPLSMSTAEKATAALAAAPLGIFRSERIFGVWGFGLGIWFDWGLGFHLAQGFRKFVGYEPNGI